MSNLWIQYKCNGTHPLNAPSRLKVFAMLQAYMDDSGSHDGAHNCVVAGYWGGLNRWRRFERTWSAILKREGIEEFKANQFWPRIDGKYLGPYEGWDEHRRTRFIRDLLVAIFESGIVPFGCGVLGGEWDQQPLTLREIITLADAPRKAKSMFVPFQRNIYRAASYCKPGVRMNFIFDQSSVPHIKTGLVCCFDGIREQAVELNDPLKHHLGELTFADSRMAAPLQASDLLAYEMHRFAKQKDRGLSKMRDAYKIALLRMKTNEDFWLFDGPRFERIQKIFGRDKNAIKSGMENLQLGNG